MNITFNGFSFIREKLKKKNIPYLNALITLPEGCTASGLMEKLGLSKEEVEGVFINSRVMPLDTPLADGDRVAFIPPGTPGPYRVLLGVKKIS